MTTNNDTTDRNSFREVSKLSDKALSEHKFALGNDPAIKEKKNLENIARAEEKERLKDNQATTTWGKMVQYTQRLLGPSVESQFDKQLNAIEGAYHVFCSKVERLDNLKKATDQNRSEAGLAAMKAEQYFSVCQESYVRIQKNMDRISSEVDELKKQTGDRFNPELFEKKDQYFLQREELQEVKQETDEAMRKHQRRTKQLYALENQSEGLSAQLEHLHDQKISIGIKLDEYSIKKEMNFSKNGESPAALFKQLGIYTQRMDEFLDANIGSTGLTKFNTDYVPTIDASTEDRLTTQWLKIRSSN